MKQTLPIMAVFIISIFSCAPQHQNKEKAEHYYDSAFTILGQTSHGGLSEELALKALSYSNQAIELDSQTSKYFRVRGTSYLHLKQYPLALSNHTHALKIDSTNTLAWVGSGIIYEITNRFEAAEKCYFQALHYDSSEVVAHFNLGALYSKLNKTALSIASFDKAAQLYPDYTSVYVNRGDLKLKLGKYRDAIADFNKAISLDSVDKISYNNRGLCEYYLKDYANAIADFEKALSFNLGKSFDENFDTDQYSYNNMANAYLGVGNTEKACEYWKIALAKGYTYRPEWKKIYKIDDPNALIKKHCK